MTFVNMFYMLLKWLLGWLVKLIWVEKVQGLENIPKEGSVILAANHSSYLDPICLVAIIARPIRFLTGEKMFKNPALLPFVILTKQIKIDRQAKDKSESIMKALKVLSSGEILGIFPEGRMSRSGFIQKAYGGVVKLSKKAGCGIVPISIQGAFEVWPPGKWCPKFRKQIVIHIGELLYIQKGNIKRDAVEVANTVVMREIVELGKVSK